MNNRLVKLLLILILTLALGLRIYKLDQVPPSISWDEAAVGYNAWTIANWGRDEYGKLFPLYFRSFGDDKHPIHIYSTAFFVKFLGLSEFSIRLPSAIFGTLNIFLIFLVAKVMFKTGTIGLISALFLAISPYSIHFSRFNHELNFALGFFLLGLFLFLKGLEKGNILLPLSFIGFGVSILAYHSSKVVVPLVLLLLIIVYFKRLLKLKKLFLLGLVIFTLFIIIIFLNPALLGTARVQQNIFSKERLGETSLYKITNNELLAWAEVTYNQYFWHFNPQYLFIKGDKNPRLSAQNGEFYKADLPFLILGSIILLFLRNKASLVLFGWALIAPLPSALVAEAPHAARALFMNGSWHIISAVGFIYILKLLKKKGLQIAALGVLLVILGISCKNFILNYFTQYSTRYAIEWQYGMKQIVEYVKEHPQYLQVYMTDARSQPYIFFLYYLKTPLPEYLRSVIYNNSESKSYNTVSNFGRFYFGGWDTVENSPNVGVLYILTPSQYDGLRHKGKFDVKKIIYYPNNTTAFYLVSAYE